MQNLLEIRLLGNVIIQKEGPVSFAYAKSQALLCYLAVTARAHPRLQIAELLWPEMEESSALTNLRQIVGDLRGTMGAHVRIDRQTIGFDFESPCWIDVAEFEEKAGGAVLTAHTAQLQEAMELYRGDFLDGLYVNDAPEFEGWVSAQRDRLRNLALRGLRELSQRYRRKGAEGRAQAIHYTERLLAIEPWQEEAHRQMMLLFTVDGRRGAALTQYEICRRVLAEELDVEPEAETKALYEQIRNDSLDRDPLDQSLAASDTSESQSHVGEAPGYQPARLPAFLQEDGRTNAQENDFVSRVRELGELDRFLQKAMEGHGRCVFVTGDAGAGKTHLIEEFSRRAQAKFSDLIVVSGRCNAFSGIGDPYLPFREILDTLTGDIEIRWSAGRISQENAQRLWRLLPDVYEALIDSGSDLIDALLPSGLLLARARRTASGTPSWLKRIEAYLTQRAREQGARQLTQMGLLSQYSSMLQILSRQHPLLLILDDLQWIDSSSSNLLFHLGRQIEHDNIFIVGTYREDELSLGRNGDRHPLEQVIGELRRLYGNIHIDLNQADANDFMDALFASFPNRLDKKFKDSLFAHTKGHALFAIEMLHDMQDRGDIVQDEKGLWIEGAQLDWNSLPDRVEAVIEERVGRLPMAHRETLKVASVEGEDFTAEVVARVQSIEEKRLVRLLSGELDKHYRLVKGHHSLRLGGQRLSQYEFRHILFSRYLYGEIDEIEKGYLHEAVGHALEYLYGDQAETIAVRLAYHFSRSETWDKALHYLIVAGDIASTSYADKDALDYYFRALELCEKLGDSYLETSSEILYRRGLVDLDSMDIDKMLEIARKLQNNRLEGRALALRGLLEFFMHEQNKSENTLRAALQIVGTEHKDVFLMASTFLGNLLQNFGRHQEAKQILQVNDDVILGVDDPFIRIWWASIGMLLPNWEGRFNDALDHYQRWNTVAHRVSLVYISANWMRGIVLGGKGEYQKALELLEDIQIKELRNYGADAPAILNTMGWLYGELQDPRQAMQLNTQAIDTCAKMDLVGAEQEVNSRLNLGDNLLALDRLEEAADQFKNVEAIVRNPSPEAHWMLWRYSQHLFHSQGELMLRLGDLQKALSYADECLELALSTNSRKNVVKARRLRSQVFITQNLTEEAEHELRQACTLALQVGNPVQSWKSHALLGQLLQSQNRLDDAEQAYQIAWTIIDSVAINLQREHMRQTFLNSPDVRNVQKEVPRLLI